MMVDTILEISLILFLFLFVVLFDKASRETAELRRRLDKALTAYNNIKSDMDSEQWVDVSSSYIVTDSDEVRFKTSKEIYFNARRRIATNIGFDIVKRFQPEESLTESGKTKYTYTFKIRK